MWADECVYFIVGIFSQYVCISNRHIAYFKFLALIAIFIPELLEKKKERRGVKGGEKGDEIKRRKFKTGYTRVLIAFFCPSIWWTVWFHNVFM